MRLRGWMMGTIVGAALSSAAPAGAQLRACRGEASGGFLTIHADDMHTTPRGRRLPDHEQLASVLRFLLEGFIDDLRARGVPLAVWVVPCEGRRPRSRADFTRSIIEELNRNDTVMEVWGSLDAEARPDAPLRPKARISYLLIPFESASDAPGGYFERAYAVAASGDTLEELFGRQNQEVAAYISMAVALKRSREGRYDSATLAWCAAQRALVAPSPPGDARSAELLEFVRSQAERDFREIDESPISGGAETFSDFCSELEDSV